MYLRGAQAVSGAGARQTNQPETSSQLGLRCAAVPAGWASCLISSAPKMAWDRSSCRCWCPRAGNMCLWSVGFKGISHGQDVSKAICREQGEGSFKLSSSLLKFGSFCSLAEDLKQKLGVSLARTARVLVPRHACCPAGRNLAHQLKVDPKSQTWRLQMYSRIFWGSNTTCLLFFNTLPKHTFSADIRDRQEGQLDLWLNTVWPLLGAQEGMPAVGRCAGQHAGIPSPWLSQQVTLHLPTPPACSGFVWRDPSSGEAWCAAPSPSSVEPGHRGGTLREQVREARHEEAIAQTQPAGAAQLMSIRERSDPGA